MLATPYRKNVGLPWLRQNIFPRPIDIGIDWEYSICDGGNDEKMDCRCGYLIVCVVGLLCPNVLLVLGDSGVGENRYRGSIRPHFSWGDSLRNTPWRRLLK
jgi:hypothetical protein